MKVLSRTAFMLLWFATNASFAETREVGVCEADGQRAAQSIGYNVEERKDVGDAFVAKLSCSNDVIVIKKCALIKVKNQKVQKFCYPEGSPAYYEYFDIVEYWGAAGAR